MEAIQDEDAGVTGAATSGGRSRRPMPLLLHPRRPEIPGHLGDQGPDDVAISRLGVPDGHVWQSAGKGDPSDGAAGGGTGPPESPAGPGGEQPHRELRRD